VGWWVDDVQRIANPNLRCLLHHPTRVTTRKNLGMANFKVDALDVILAVATRDVDASNFSMIFSEMVLKFLPNFVY
jgi:hypothetical protein